MKIKISRGQIIGLIIVLLFILFLIYIRIFPSKYAVTVIHKDPQNYIALFNDSTRKHLKLSAATISKQHNPIVEYIYDNNFHLQVFKIDKISNQSLKDLVVENASGINNYGSFNGIVSGDCDIEYRKGVHKISKLYLEINGQGIQVKNKSDDRFIVYMNKANNFLISYTGNGDSNICGETGEDTNNQANDSCELLFLKKNGFVYFAFISPEVGGVSVQPGMLEKMID